MAAAQSPVLDTSRRPRRPAWQAPVVVALALAWSGIWIAMGLTVAAEVRGLTKLSDTVVAVGQAAERSGETLSTLDDLPVIGERVREPARSVTAAGRSAVASGMASRESAQNLSVLLGISIAVIPSTPLLFLLPFALGVRRRPAAPRR